MDQKTSIKEQTITPSLSKGLQKRIRREGNDLLENKLGLTGLDVPECRSRKKWIKNSITNVKNIFGSYAFMPSFQDSVKADKAYLFLLLPDDEKSWGLRHYSINGKKFTHQDHTILSVSNHCIERCFERAFTINDIDNLNDCISKMVYMIAEVWAQSRLLIDNDVNRLYEDINVPTSKGLFCLTNNDKTYTHEWVIKTFIGNNHLSNKKNSEKKKLAMIANLEWQKISATLNQPKRQNDVNPLTKAIQESNLPK